MIATKEQILLTLNLLRGLRMRRAIMNHSSASPDRRQHVNDAYAISDYDAMIHRYLNG
jgi:hypothetical protein